MLSFELVSPARVLVQGGITPAMIRAMPPTTKLNSACSAEFDLAAYLAVLAASPKCDPIPPFVLQLLSAPPTPREAVIAPKILAAALPYQLEGIQRGIDRAGTSLALPGPD